LLNLCWCQDGVVSVTGEDDVIGHDVSLSRGCGNIADLGLQCKGFSNYLSN
jgi:hypothetical protein